MLELVAPVEAFLIFVLEFVDVLRIRRRHLLAGALLFRKFVLQRRDSFEPLIPSPIELEGPAVLFLEMPGLLLMNRDELLALADHPLHRHSGLIEFVFEEIDVMLAFPKQVRSTRNIEKRTDRRQPFNPAYGEKEMCFLRGVASSVQSESSGGNRMRIKREGFQAVLQEHHGMRKEFTKRLLKFRELEFVGVERIRDRSLRAIRRNRFCSA